MITRIKLNSYFLLNYLKLKFIIYYNKINIFLVTNLNLDVVLYFEKFINIFFLFANKIFLFYQLINMIYLKKINTHKLNLRLKIKLFNHYLI